ncbi:MAG: EAL domain-containing protein [Methylobacter sp.]|nr:EAL domain-containing protein [Methylobacter sp.]
MPLQNLVEYFNDRFGQEHRSSFRPFILEQGKISGLFGPVRIDSSFSPLRQTLKPAAIIGHTAKIKVSTYEVQHLYSSEIENLLPHNSFQTNEFESIINFDRLSRTVHMLNFLPLTHLHDLLFLEVDPRHILGVKQDHGAYFQEVITQCGLETKNIVIILAVNSQYIRYHQVLIEGLENYRHRGYQIGLKFDSVAKESQTFEFIQKLSPDYVSLSARYLDNVRDNTLPAKLHKLKALVTSTGGQNILQHIDEKRSDSLARNTGFDLVQGSYYERSLAPVFSSESSDSGVSAYG